MLDHALLPGTDIPAVEDQKQQGVEIKQVVKHDD